MQLYELHTSPTLRPTLLPVETRQSGRCVEISILCSTEALHPVVIQEVDPWRERQREKEVQNPFTYSPPSFQSPSGCSMWQHTENSLCKINSFQHVSHAKFPSARASGKCGHQLPYEQIHCCVWRVYTFICWHILLTICNAASASLDVREKEEVDLYQIVCFMILFFTLLAVWVIFQFILLEALWGKTLHNAFFFPNTCPTKPLAWQCGYFNSNWEEGIFLS